MNALARFPTRLHWTAQQLADAVPLRLHELFAFDAQRDSAARTAANTLRKPRLGTGYLRSSPALPSFRIR